ncbi:MAG: methyltransferase [Spirulinaceae cyanobacterium]
MQINDIKLSYTPIAFCESTRTPLPPSQGGLRGIDLPHAYKNRYMISPLTRLTRKLHQLLNNKPKNPPRVERLYGEEKYLEAYRKHTDLRVDQDPKTAIGGMWEEIGLLQFDFLRAQGMQPQHKLLDIGCGTLRGGRHGIRYLNTGNYTGIDLSPKAIAAGQQLLETENLADKHPRLLVNSKQNLKFEQFTGETFDYLLAQSVFTHLKPEHIQECFAYVGDIMDDQSIFFFTYQSALKYTQTNLKDFRYPKSFFESLATQHGFQLSDYAAQYAHPRNQLMLGIQKIQR